MANTREEILGAAKKLLWSVGYDGMSPRMVMRDSGAGQGSLYHHFSGKRDLAETALKEVEDEMTAGLTKMFAAEIPPLERVRAFLCKPRNGIKGCKLGRFANESAIDDPTLQAPVMRFFKACEAHLEAALDEARALGDLPSSTNPNALAATIMASIQGGYALSRIHKDKSYMARATQGALDLINAARSCAAETKEQ